MQDNGEKQDKRPGRFKVPLSELRKMFMKTPKDRMKVSEMSAAQVKEQRSEDCKRSAYNAHLRKAILEAEMKEKYAFNLKKRDELLEEVANLRKLVGV
jgi:predicted ATP-dependent protease